MNEFERYVKDCLSYNRQLKEFLDQEGIQEDGLWEHLNNFGKMMEGVSNKQDLTIDQLLNIQSQVDELHDTMENYFVKRQQVGAIYLHEPSVGIGNHKLPQLPYRYDSLEPYIAREIMELHHTKHHQSYVAGLNNAEKKLEEARQNKEYSLVKHWSRELAFHGSGHYLHTLFWETMKEKGGGEPSGRLLEEIKSYFGSFKAFKDHFTEAAKAVEGSGWAILIWSLRARHLEIVQSEKHMNLTQWDTIPLLPLDVWEHAYYLQYKNDRAAYIANWWNVVNWKVVEERLNKAIDLKWKPV